MTKSKGITMNGPSILGYCLTIVGVLTVIWGGDLVPPRFNRVQIHVLRDERDHPCCYRPMFYFGSPDRSVGRRDLGGNADHNDLHLVAAQNGTACEDHKFCAAHCLRNMADREAAQVDTGPARQAHGVGLGSPWLHAGPSPTSTTRLHIRFRFGSERATALLAFVSSKQRNEFGTNA